MKPHLLILIGIAALCGCVSKGSSDAILREQIAEQTALFRRGQVPTDSTHHVLVQRARESGDKAALCHALYLQGSVYNYSRRYNEVMAPLKEAETLIPYLEASDPVAGMIYVVQGSALEQNDYLWAEAGEKYEAALPYFERSKDTLRLATTYRDIARMSLWRADTVRYEEAFKKAIELSRRQSNRLIYHDIRMQYLLNHYPSDTLAMIDENKVLCDSFGLYRYAWIPAEYHLRRGEIEECSYWLEVFAPDTTYTRWSAEKYRYLQAALLNKRGSPQRAYDDLKTLYESTTKRIYSEGITRAYAVARLYDLERERQKTLQLQVDKQRLGLALAGIALLLLLSLLWLLWERSKRLRREHEHAIAQLQAEETQRQLADKRAALKRILEQRVRFTVRLKRSANTLPKGLPDWAKTYIDEVAFSNDESWKAFLQEFNSIYGEYLSNLHKQFPALTEQDDKYLALALLGFDNSEIAVLLNASDRTIWNRRQKIKTRLGDSHMDLDSWVRM